MQLKFLYILIVILTLLTVNIGSLEINIYLYLVIAFFIAFGFFTNQNIRGWYWLSFFLIFYSFPHFTTYYLIGENNIITNKTLHSVMNDTNYNLEAIRLISSFILCLLLGYLLFGFFSKNKPFLYEKSTFYKNHDISFYKKSFFFLFISLLLVSSILTIDFAALKDSYKLTSGFTLLFSACYILNFFIIYIFFNENFKSKYLLIFIIIYGFLLGYLGVRQVLFWLLLSLLISYFLKAYMQNKKINWFSIALSGFIFFAFISLVLGYRTSKEFDLDILYSIGTIGFYAILAETSFTLYNIFASIELSSTTDFFFMKDFLDIFYFLIPSQILPNKYEYISTIQFAKEYNIAPFGTYYYLGELKLSLRYDLLIYLFGILIGFTSEYFLSYVLKNKSQLLFVLYISFIVMLLVYPVRGTIPSGAKIFISFNLLIYLLLKYKVIYGRK